MLDPREGDVALRLLASAGDDAMSSDARRRLHVALGVGAGIATTATAGAALKGAAKVASGVVLKWIAIGVVGGGAAVGVAWTAARPAALAPAATAPAATAMISPAARSIAASPPLGVAPPPSAAVPPPPFAVLPSAPVAVSSPPAPRAPAVARADRDVIRAAPPPPPVGHAQSAQSAQSAELAGGGQVVEPTSRGSAASPLAAAGSEHSPAVDRAMPPDAPPPRPDRGAPAAQLAPDRAPAVSALAAEARLIERARESIARGRLRDAIAALEEHREGFAAGAFGEEALVLRVDALRRLGDAAAARRIAKEFLEARPRSAYAPRVRAMIEAMEAR